MDKYRLFKGFLFCPIFLLASQLSTFAQGREWTRYRAGVASSEDTVFSGQKLPPVEYFISAGDTMDVLLFVNYGALGKEALEDKNVWVKQVELVPGSVDELQHAVVSRKKGADASAESGQDDADFRYAIASGDVLDVSVWQNPDLSKEVIVGPDGQISYPLVGRVRAAGLTLSELEAVFRESISKFVRYPQVTVMVKKYGELDRVTWRNPDLSRLEVIVAPDGKISYPLAGSVRAAGLTIGQLEQSLQKEVAKYIRNPRVSVMMKKFAENKERVVILGEVNYPGIYTFEGMLNIVQGLGMAGDFTEKARRDSILVIRGDLKSGPEIIRINLQKALVKGTSDLNFELKPRDVIYVPKSFIADFNKFLSNITPTLDTAEKILQIDIDKQSSKTF